MSRSSLPVVGKEIGKKDPPNEDSAPALLADAGFSGNALLVTLGCAKNLVDSEVMLGVLGNHGFRLVSEPELADLIVVNTCAFLQSAVEESIDRILELSVYRKQGRCRRLVVAGCMVERYRQGLGESLPEVDRFISTDELLEVWTTDITAVETFNAARRPYFLYDETMPRVLSTRGHSAYLKIAEGCDRPCSFCIIPKIRGPYRSRSIASIVAETQKLLGDGVREINLLAQDLTNYGSDLPVAGEEQVSLERLLRELGGLDEKFGKHWLRLLYAYPLGCSDDLLRVIYHSPTICNYLDLPLQQISDPVLRRMLRPLGEKGTRKLIERIKKIAPGLALRTTFLVGFPGETEDDICALEEFVAEGHFVHLGVFAYSQESEASSYDMDGQVDEREKEERRARIMLAQQRVVERRLASLVGGKETVLIDGFHPESEMLLVGRAEWQGPETDGEFIINDIDITAKVHGGPVEQFIGRFVEAEVTEVAGYDLVARIVRMNNE